MAYIGRNPAIGTQKVLDSLESQFNGSLTTFNLRYNSNTIYPTLASSLIVSLGGVLQEPGTAYTVASDQITFASAPTAGTDCWILLYSEFGGVAGATPNLTVGNTLTVQGLTDLDGDINIDSGQLTYTASSNIAKFADDAKLIFGDGDDLQIYHDGSHSWINDQGVGHLYITTNGDRVNINGGSDSLAKFNKDGSVELYYDNSKKFETTSTGATITGTALATALSTGASGTGINISTNTISGPATLTIDPAAVGDDTGLVIIKGDFQVDGTTTTINSTTLTVDDKNIVLASGAANAAAADGAGVTVDGADATLLYKATPDAWSFNKSVGIGTDNPDAFSPSADDLVIRTTGDTGITIRSGASNSGNIFFASADGATSNNGIIQYLQNTKELRFQNYGSGSEFFTFYTQGNERLRLTSDGKLILSGTQRTTPFISGDGGMCIEQSYDGNLRALTIRNKDTDAAAATSLAFSLNRSGGDQDFIAGEIKLVKEQAWTTSSATVDGGMVFSTIRNGTAGERLRITSAGTLNAPAGIGPQIRFKNQHSVTTDAAISTFDDANGVLVSVGSNYFFNSSGSDSRYNTSEESCAVVLNRTGDITLKTGDTSATATTRLSIGTDGMVNVPDGGKFTVGNGDDLQIYHDATNSHIQNTTGSFFIDQTVDDNDLNFRCDNGSGGLTTYIQADGSTGKVKLFDYGSLKLETTTTGAKVTGALEVTQEYPTIRPTLDLNFAATKTLDRRITFTRDSIGTYVDELGIVRYASNNVPRFDHDPDTGESLGLLIEERRTNINKVSTFRVSNADRFSINSASEQTAGENTNGVIGPDGTANGVCRAFFTGSESNPSGSVYVMASTSSSNGADFTTTNTHTSSVWIRPGLETVWKIQGHSNYASASAGGSATTIDFIFTLTGEGTVTSIESGGIAASVKKYPNNWYRCTITYHRNSSASVDSGYGVIIYPNVYINYNVNSQTGDIGWFWGPQVEEGAFATSYIPTGGSTVTRNKDIAVIKGTNFTDLFNTSFKELSLFVDYDNSQTDDGTYYEIVSFWGESAGFNDRIGISKDNDSPYHIETRAFGGGGGIFTNGNLSASSKAASQKFATSWSVPDYSNTTSRRWAFCFSGETPVDVVNDGSGSSVPAITRLGIGISPTRLQETETGGLIHYKRVAAWNKTLTDAQLQGLTQQ